MIKARVLFVCRACYSIQFQPPQTNPMWRVMNGGCRMCILMSCEAVLNACTLRIVLPAVADPIDLSMMQGVCN
eukprot:m.46571 g.46571  ORF g.46571 m.46571 type:complete len:73 (+) comp15167_c0_seq1:92-310(+)